MTTRKMLRTMVSTGKMMWKLMVGEKRIFDKRTV
jgi:hypothetical protein